MPEEKPFQMVVLGDSIQWGQGLLEEDKFSELVRRQIEKELRRPALLVHRYARSGASIGRETDGIDGQGNPTAGNFDPGTSYGELPSGTPTIHAQLNALLLDDSITGEDIDLVLLDGGINPDQVGGPEETNPFEKALQPLTAHDDLRSDTMKACYERMRGLLERITAGLPNARVVVTGYYPIFSHRSYMPLAIPWLQMAVMQFPLASLIEGALRFSLTKLSEVWADTSALALRQAVDEVNGQLGDPRRVGYAHVPFEPENCIFAPKSWLWGLSSLLTPEDPVADGRIELAKETGREKDPFSIWASVGHPNREGSRQYYQAIVRTLRDLRVLPGTPSLVDVIRDRITDYVDRLRGGSA